MARRTVVHRHEDASGLHEWVETAPSTGLRPWITGYTGYREWGEKGVRRRETPSGGAVLVLSFGDPLTVGDTPRLRPGAPAPHTAPEAGSVTSFAGGLSDRPALTAHDGRQHGIQVRLEPPAVFALFGVPLDEIGGRPGGVVDLAELGADSWGARLGSLSSWGQRFALLDALLTDALARCTIAPNPEILDAWRRLRASHGTVRVADLVHQSGVSHPTFLRRFRRQVGVGPKAAARVLRYERATALLGQGASSVAGIAAACGYADQAHLDREFAALAGCPPTQVVRDRSVAQYQSIRSILSKTAQGSRRTVAP